MLWKRKSAGKHGFIQAFAKQKSNTRSPYKIFSAKTFALSTIGLLVKRGDAWLIAMKVAQDWVFLVANNLH